MRCGGPGPAEELVSGRGQPVPLRPEVPRELLRLLVLPLPPPAGEMSLRGGTPAPYSVRPPSRPGGRQMREPLV